jgi:hypothetical protein
VIAVPRAQARAHEIVTQALRVLTAQVKPDWTSAALTGLASVPELTQELERIRLGVIDTILPDTD